MLDEFKDDTRVVHCQREPYDVYIGRPSFWENPYTHHKTKKTLAKYVVRTREEAISRYRDWVMSQPKMLLKLEELQGKRLGCWCKPLQCHGDVLIQLLREM
jgi:hypothetical protein